MTREELVYAVALVLDNGCAHVDDEMDAFTAPDADWWTILDSLRARIRDLGGGIQDGCYDDTTCSHCDGAGCEACDARENDYREFVADVSNWREVPAVPPSVCPTCGSDDPAFVFEPCDPENGGLFPEAWHRSMPLERWSALDVARNIVNQTLDLAGTGVDKRQAINDRADEFAADLLVRWRGGSGVQAVEDV